jgi:hypothetical protein
MRYEEKTYSIDRANHNLLAAGGHSHRLFSFEAEHFSTPIIDALSAYLGKCVLPLQILAQPITKIQAFRCFLDTFLTHLGQFLRLN